jgi:hypothetical protein
MDYGDVQAFNPKSEIPTPNLNKLSEEGIMFLDINISSKPCKRPPLNSSVRLPRQKAH